MSVIEAWERYVFQVKHVGAEALLGLLRPGCEEHEIDRVEEVTGYPLSEEAKELYRLHDGQERRQEEPVFLFHGEMFPGEHWHSLDELIECQQYLRSVAEDFADVLEYASDEPELAAGNYHLAWLPFSTNGCGDYNCIDMAPSGRGRLGQIVSYAHDGDAGLRNVCLADYIDRQCRLIVTGEYTCQYEDDFGFIWDSQR